jgi:hypothetical protein
MFVYIQWSTLYEHVFSYCCRYGKVHNEYHQHVSQTSRTSVFATRAINALLLPPLLPSLLRGFQQRLSSTTVHIDCHIIV